MATLADVNLRGTHADRPSAAVEGRTYYETDTQSLFRDNGSSWDAQTQPSDLTALTDVLVTSPANGDVMTWNATAGKWENVAPVTPPSALDDLTDVATAGEVAGKLLGFNGADWVPTDPPSGGGGGGGGVVAMNIVRLTYAPSTDLATGVAAGAGSHTTIGASQTFTVGSAESEVEAVLNLNVIAVGGVNSGADCSTSLLIDGTTRYHLAGATGANIDTGDAVAALGGGTVRLTGLIAGSHTIAVQVYTDTATTLNCRPTGAAEREFLHLEVIERLPATGLLPIDQVRYHQATPQSIAFNVAPTIVNFDTLDWDDTGLVTTGAAWTFTANKDGKYRVSVLVNLGLLDWNNNHNALYLYKNGTQIEQLDGSFGSAGVSAPSLLQGVDEIALLTGDTIDVRVVQQAGTGAAINIVAARITVERSDSVGSNSGTSLAARLPATVTLTSANTFYDLVSLTLGPGMWLIQGRAAFYLSSSATGDQNGIALHDGTNYIEFAGTGGGTGSTSADVDLTAIVSPTITTTYTLRAASSRAGNQILPIAPYTLDPGGLTETKLTALAAGGGAPSGDTAWTALTYTNSWGTYETGWDPAQCRKTADGMVVISGMVTGGADLTSIATLPVGYRPLNNIIVPVVMAATSGTYGMRLQILPDGTMVPSANGGGTIDWLSLVGISFFAEG